MNTRTRQSQRKRRGGQILTALTVSVLLFLPACQSTQPTIVLPEIEWVQTKPGWVLIRELDLKRLIVENEQNKKRLEILRLRQGVSIP